MAGAPEEEHYAWFEDPRTRSRYKMDVRISRTPGGFTGNGKDFVGEFVLLDGEFEARSNGWYSVSFLKQYNHAHGVVYEGFGRLGNSKLKAAGRWYLEDFVFIQGEWEFRLLIAPPAA